MPKETKKKKTTSAAATEGPSVKKPKPAAKKKGIQLPQLGGSTSDFLAILKKKADDISNN